MWFKKKDELDSLFLYEYDVEKAFRKNLNIRKVAIVAGIIIAIIIVVALILHTPAPAPKNETSSEITAPSGSIFYNSTNSVSIELSKAYNLKQYSSEHYIIELRSFDNLGIFISETEVIPNKKLSSIVETDKQSFLEEFEGHSNLSDTKELLVRGNPAYTYSFHYLDTNLNKPFYIQIVWLEIDNIYYIFDIEFPLEDMIINTNVITETLTSFAYQLAPSKQ